MVRIMISRKMGELRVNQAELSRMTGISAATINEYYHDLVSRVNLEYIDKICDALQCDISEILEYVPNDPPLIVAGRAGKLKAKTPMR